MRSNPTRKRAALIVNFILLASALLTLASGLVLFLGFHIGSGHLRLSAAGLSRLTWVSLHRVPTVLMVAAVGAHLALNGRAFVARLRHAFSRMRGNGLELVLYATFFAAMITGIVVAILAGGSAPASGPSLGHVLAHAHSVVGFVALGFSGHHVGHRWQRMMPGHAQGHLPASNETSRSTCARAS